MSIEELVRTVVILIMPIFGAAIALYAVRIIKGPTVSDMALAVDCLSYDVCFFIALLAVYFKAPFLVVCSICLALWTYVFSIYLAKYLERRELGE
ncbi:MAG: monovalent cation/H+ antiporter complex subunit F [Candidatus Nezhaarchaeota archaeon]|nr:monovalent cation/H+ antiporter complex subunit F [Candidatus Nezhaarchaeota archaeon]